ncbi:efflux RND transporter permease subunit [Parashewanella tropica]|uniref:efflux RND transporter permease subunit n=1 Tax=Parashewanella tropica TaxID=2547970 RepID=UPI00105947B3|nr:efflux RND transporter permease subunit [Parashewanella tropica]
MKDLITNIALHRPKTIYVIMLLVTALSLAMFPKIQIDTDPENMLSASDPARLFHNQAKQAFAMYDMIVIGAVSHSNSGIYNPNSLAELNKLSRFIQSIQHVRASDQLSLDTVDNITQAEQGGIRFQWLMKTAPKTQEQSNQIRKAVERLPLLANTLVSNDGKAAAIYVAVENKKYSYQIAENIRQFLPSLNSSDEYYITGLPVAEDQFGSEMFVQMAIAAPLAGVAIFILMWWFFRSLPLVIGPMIVAMATVIITMGALIGMGFTVHIMSSMIAIFLMPIAVVDSTHILSEFADHYRKDQDAKNVIKKVIKELYKPILFTSLTSAVGFLSLTLTPIPPVKVFGSFIAFGILLAFILTIFFIPAYIGRMSPQALANLQQAMNRKGKLDSVVAKIGAGAVGKRKLILVTFVSLFAISLIGISKIQVNDNPINWFKPSHEIRVADKALNQHFAGTYDAWLVLNYDDDNKQQSINQLRRLLQTQQLNDEDIHQALNHARRDNDPQWLQSLATLIDDKMFDTEGEQLGKLESLLATVDKLKSQQQQFLSPKILNWMEGLNQALVDSPLVGKVNGLPDIIKTVNRELKGGEPHHFVLPSTQPAIAQTLLQYQSSHRPQDLWHFVTPDYRSSLMWLQLTSGDNQHMSKVIDFVDGYVKQRPLPEGISLNWAGKAYINVIWQKAMVNGMLESLLSSFLVVFLMMVLLFRSIKYGLLAMLPLTLTITMIYGLIGWIGKDYDMPIAVLSALTLGLSVDFAIHFIERFRVNLAQFGSVSEALKAMFEEPARAISRNAIVIAVGFTPLLFAPLVPYITVGLFLASIMAASALVTLLVLPAILSFKRSKV